MFCPECGVELPAGRNIGNNVVCPVADGGCGQLVIPVEEVGWEEVELDVPNCFGFYDPRDNTCSRCDVSSYCSDELDNKRQPCFGSYEPNIVECIYCLLASQCADETNEKENSSKMAKVKIRKPPARAGRRPSRPVKPVEPEPEEELLEEELGDEDMEFEEEEGGDVADYGAMSLPALKKLAEERGVTPKGRRKSHYVSAMTQADDAGDEEDEEPERPAPAVRKSRPAVRKPRPRRAEPVAEEEPEEDDGGQDGNPIVSMLEALEQGMALHIQRSGDGWTVQKASVVKAQASTGRRGYAMTYREFEEEAFTPEFYEFHYEDAAGTGKPWSEMTVKERYAVAKEIGAEWEKHENEKTDQMRMGLAVRKKLGIKKWKKQYSTTASRKALREDGVYLS